MALLNLQLNLKSVVGKWVEVVLNLEGFLLAPDPEVARLAVLGVVLVAVRVAAGDVCVHEGHFVSDIAFINLR